MKRKHKAYGTVAFPIVDTYVQPETSIAALEMLRDKTAAEEWASPASQRAVLFGIKLCIAKLKRENINEIL